MIDFNAYFSLIYHFFTAHKFIAVGLGVVILLFCYKKPVEAVKFFGFCALLLTALYIMSLLSESGSLGELHKKEITDQPENSLTN
tara:strand:- start:394 stop:648 length:255 start_codon:yes stop_codon:yes gene_type:complete